MQNDYQEGYKEYLDQKINNYENGIFFEIFNEVLYQRKNILSKKNWIKKIIKDIDKEILEDPCKSVPAFQTQPNLHKKYKETDHWDYLISTINEDIKKYFFTTNKNTKVTSLKCQACWANVSKPESNYTYHNHQTDITLVYFLKNPSKIYGTLLNFEDVEIIMCAEENSLLIFNPKLNHCVVSPPPQISALDPRYSIVFDFSFEYE